MKKKYVGIVYKLDNDDGFAECKIFIRDFESTKKWFKEWTEGSDYSDYKNDFSEENTNVDIFWEENDGVDEFKLCIVDNWNDDKQVSKFRSILNEWCEYACDCWQERNWDISKCFDLMVFDNEDFSEIYNVLDDEDFIHSEDGEYEHDLFIYNSDSTEYLFNKIAGLVNKETEATPKKGEQSKDPTKDFVDVIADKLLAKAMDKVNTKIGNSEDLFDDAVINSIVDKLFEKVSDQLNKRLGL